MKTILVVDDFASVRFYHETLLRQAGYATVPARDGAEAMASLEKSPVALVLLDLLMPKMNGREFLARIRAMSNYAALPVLLITSETRVEGSDLQPSENCGVLTKPILPQDLIKEVRRLLKENAKEAEARA